MSEEAREERVRLAGLRGMIASKMVESLQTAAQLTYFATVDASAMVAKRAAFKARQLQIGYEDFLIHTLAQVLPAHRSLNGTIDGKDAILPEAIHVSVAVASPRGLVAPAIFDAQAKSLEEISAARRDLQARAAENKLQVKEMTGGTITISNLGHTRVEHFTPILNAPQIAILGIGRIAPQPFAGEGSAVEMRPAMGLSLTADHRLVDGDPAGRFLSAYCEALEAI